MPDSNEFGPFVAYLCGQFLAEAKGDIDKAARLMFADLAGAASHNTELEQAIKRAMADYKARS
jgi:hypothetical protein